MRALKRVGEFKMQKAVHKFDFGKPLMWDLPECMEQFRALVDNPPIHSVVVTVAPPMAKSILKAANDRNRPLNRGATGNLWAEIEVGQFELTGDTIKVSKRGRLIDGQHRLEACVRSNKPVETHVVFGLAESVFDILDRQRTRTAADILAISGVKDATIVAGATRWARIISERKRSVMGGGIRRDGKGNRDQRSPTPRQTRELVAGPMKDIGLYTRAAEEIRKAYKIAPTITCGLLWAIAQGGHHVAAEGFANDWLHGNRNYSRNKNFDVLNSRIATVRAQSNGHLNRVVLAAMLVQCFNHWNANIAATPRSLTWKKEWAFPPIMHDAKSFVRLKDEMRLSDTSLPAIQLRVLAAMAASADGEGKIKVGMREIAEKASIPLRQIPYVVNTMVKARQLYIDKKGGHGSTTIYRIGDLDKAKLVAA